MSVAVSEGGSGLFGWWAAGTPAARRALVAAALGWMLDSFDVMLYALVLAAIIGMWFGYVTFGFISDAIGRRRSYVIYTIAAAVLIFAYVSIRNPVGLLLLGPFVAFFATGYFSGFGAVTAELYHTAIRATAQGFTYNIGRVASAFAPFAVGSIAQSHGFRFALSMTSCAFLLAALTWIWIPETRGRQLT